MSDSSESAFSFLSNWKFGLAVCVPCFAVGLGVTYYYYSKTPGTKPSGRLEGGVPVTNKSTVVDVVDGCEAAEKLLANGGDGVVAQSPVKNPIKVSRTL